MTTKGNSTMPSTPAPPDWCEPGAASQTVDLATGDSIESWERVVSRDVWIAAEDHSIEGHVFRTPARVHVGEQPHRLDAEDARRLAADLLAAADLIDD